MESNLLMRLLTALGLSAAAVLVGTAVFVTACGTASVGADASANVTSTEQHKLGVGPIGPYPIKLLGTDGGVDGGSPTITGSGVVWQTPSISSIAGVPHGASAQMLLTNATPATAWTTESGDCTISATGVQTCTQLQGGEITAGASTGTLTCATGATACGETQTIAGNSSIPANMVWSPQAPGASCTTSQNCSPGSLVVNLAANGATGSPATPGFQVKYNGALVATLYPDIAATQYGEMCMGSTACNGSNWAIASDGAANTQFNVPSGGTFGWYQNSSGGLASLSAATGFTLNTSESFTGGLTSPGLSQASTTTSPGTNMVFTPQPCTTTSPCTSGNFDVNLTAPVGAGAEADFVINRSGTGIAYVGGYPGSGSTYSGLWFGASGSPVTPGALNFTMITDSTNTFLNSPSSSGSLLLREGDGSSAGLGQISMNQNGVQLFRNQSTYDWGGGVGVLVVTGPNTTPTSAPTVSGDTIMWSDSVGYHFWDHSAAGSSVVGWDSTVSGDAVWLTPSGGTYTDATAVLSTNGASTIVNAKSTAGGILAVGGFSGTIAGAWNAQGISVGNPSTEQASGAGVLQFTPETSLPTSCSTSLSACIYDNGNTGAVSNGLVVMDNQKLKTTLAPQYSALGGTGTGGIDLQVLSDGAYIGFGKTVGSQTAIANFPVPSGSACDVDWTCIGRVTVAGTYPTTVGNAIIQRMADGVVDIAGTVALAGGAITTIQNKSPASYSSAPITCTASYATANTYTITASTCATCGTFDWTIKAKLNCE